MSYLGIIIQTDKESVRKKPTERLRKMEKGEPR